MTKQRKIIYDIIINSTEHLSAEEIFLRAKRTLTSIAFGTVYRNLGLMVEAGDIGKVEIAGDPTRYDRSCIPHNHSVCVKCGKVEDVNIDGIREIITSNVKNLVNYHIAINYICEDCAERKEAII